MGAVSASFLPPRELWPDRVYTLPEPARYAARLNSTEELIDRQVEAGHGDRVALLYEDQRTTYRELQAAASRLGSALRALGVEEDRVLLRAPFDPPGPPTSGRGTSRSCRSCRGRPVPRGRGPVSSCAGSCASRPSASKGRTGDGPLRGPRRPGDRRLVRHRSGARAGVRARGCGSGPGGSPGAPARGTRRGVRALGRRALVVACDVTQDGALDRAVGQAVEAFGRLDVAVANAGFGVVGPFERLALDDYRRQFETNVFGVLRTAAAALPALRRTRGTLVIIGSVSGHVPIAGASPYAMSKAAVRALAGSCERRCGAPEWASFS